MLGHLVFPALYGQTIIGPNIQIVIVIIDAIGNKVAIFPQTVKWSPVQIKIGQITILS
jgi:hypothetical protein